MDEDRELAKKIAAISSFPEDAAFEALQAGGRHRELVLSILEADSQYAENNASVAAAKRKLVDLIPA